MPSPRQVSGGNIWDVIKSDFKESIYFIWKDKPVIGKTLLTICGVNLFLSSMINVALPYLVTEVLDLGAVRANRLYGLAQGALAAGGLAGGICAGILARRLSVQKSGNLVVVGAMCVFPIGAALAVFSSGMVNYVVITVCCFSIMVFSTIFTVQMMSFFQAETPQNLIGKVIAVILTIAMCAQPLGNAFYGVLFELFKGLEYVVVLFAGGMSLVIAMWTRRILKRYLCQ